MTTVQQAAIVLVLQRLAEMPGWSGRRYDTGGEPIAAVEVCYGGRAAGIIYAWAAGLHCRSSSALFTTGPFPYADPECVELVIARLQRERSRPRKAP